MQSENVNKHLKLNIASEQYLLNGSFTQEELDEITQTKALLKRQKSKKPVQS